MDFDECLMQIESSLKFDWFIWLLILVLSVRSDVHILSPAQMRTRACDTASYEVDEGA